MRAGKLRDRITVQAMTETADELGQMIQAWADVGTFWAGVSEIQGKYVEVGGQVRSDLTHEVTVRRLSVRLSPARHRIVGVSGQLAGRTLNIEAAVDTDGRDRVYKLACKEIVL